MAHKINGSVCILVLGLRVGTLSVQQGKQKNVENYIFHHK